MRALATVTALQIRDPRCEFITSKEPSRGINDIFPPLSRREGRRVRQASVKASVSMFNYTTITRIKSNSSIKDCSVIIDVFKHSLGAGAGVILLLTEETEGEENPVACGGRGQASGSGEDPDASLNCRLKVGNYPVIIQR